MAMLNHHSPAFSRVRQQNIFSVPLTQEIDDRIHVPSYSVTEFLNFLSDALPAGGLYLFGGVLRDLAMFGRKGFTSDIDVVIDGDACHLKEYLKALDASINRFGGFRLIVDGWPIDLWDARETWAIRQGLVRYSSILSLTKTTILNWDAILFNWRTKRILCGKNYFEQLQERTMDIVLEENPNPLRAAVRAFRHLCMNDARRITMRAAKYLSRSAKRYSTEEILISEISSYSNRVINPLVLKFFRELDTSSDRTIEICFLKRRTERGVYGVENAHQIQLI